MRKINACVVGSAGKMGQALLAEIAQDPDFGPALELNVSRHTDLAQKELLSNEKPSPFLHLVFDFTAPAVTLKTARYCAKNHLPLVTGTTGFDQKQMASLRRYARKTPILWSPNMSLAVILIEMLLPLFGKVLGQADIEIVEQHHRGKEDAPSGTALLWAERLSLILGKKPVCGRTQGISAGRDDREIYIHSLRGGQAAGGQNEVVFLADQEEVRISHRALSNQVYAQGALAAGKWLIGRKPHFYTMRDLLPKF